MIADQLARSEESGSPTGSRRTDVYRIAHLSDLHFGSTFDSGLWDYVRGVLAEHKPDLVVVTGDLVDTPSLFRMGLVLQELRRVETETNCNLLLVPGNHDVAILGNVKVWPWSGKYRIVFSKVHDRHFKALCSFSEFQAFSRFRKIAYRCGWWARLTFLRLTFQLKDPGEDPTSVLNGTIADGRAIFACFNSNAQLWLATGRVDHKAIQSLDRGIELLSRQGNVGWLAPRVALVHHHALAIPYSTTTESPTSFEPFLTMRNAGTLLRELGKLDFDVLLHGHKHALNFARLSFDYSGRIASETAIIAAASATAKQMRAGSNSINLIDIMANGLIVHHPLFFGQGMTTAPGQMEAAEVARAILTLAQIKERAYRKARRSLQCDCELQEREIKIDLSGSANFSLRVHKYRALGSRHVRRVWMHAAVSSGGINPKSVKLDGDLGNHDHSLALDRDARATKSLTIPIDLGSEVFEGRTDSVDFGVQFRSLNNFAVSKWEAAMLPGPSDIEWAGIVVRQPAHQLRLTVEIPSCYVDGDAFVLCQRPTSYPALEFDKDGEICLPAKEKEWITDQDFTNLESERLTVLVVPSPSGKVFADILRCELIVDRPMVGFRYLVCWPVRDQTGDCGSESKGAAIQLRQTLLRVREVSSCPPWLAAIRSELQMVLDEVFQNVIEPSYRSRFMKDETLIVGIFIYSEQTNALELLLEAGRGGALSGRCDSIPLNEGVVGSVFKNRKAALFQLPDVADVTENDGLYVYYQPEWLAKQESEFAALVAIPLYWGTYQNPEGQLTDPISPIPPDAMIGVLLVASDARDSGLLRLKTQQGEEDGDVLRAFGEGFVCGLTDLFERCLPEGIGSAGETRQSET